RHAPPVRCSAWFGLLVADLSERPAPDQVERVRLEAGFSVKQLDDLAGILQDTLDRLIGPELLEPVGVQRAAVIPRAAAGCSWAATQPRPPPRPRLNRPAPTESSASRSSHTEPSPEVLDTRSENLNRVTNPVGLPGAIGRFVADPDDPAGRVGGAGRVR